jgi:hypothetical protein
MVQLPTPTTVQVSPEIEATLVLLDVNVQAPEPKEVGGVSVNGASVRSFAGTENTDTVFFLAMVFTTVETVVPPNTAVAACVAVIVVVPILPMMDAVLPDIEITSGSLDE